MEPLLDAKARADLITDAVACLMDAPELASAKALISIAVSLAELAERFKHKPEPLEVPEEPTFPCYECGETFDDAHARRVHYWQEHKHEPPQRHSPVFIEGRCADLGGHVWSPDSIGAPERTCQRCGKVELRSIATGEWHALVPGQ